MKTTENITVTDGRLDQALKRRVEPLILPHVAKQINQTMTKSKLQIGTMTKFYPYLDRCEVKLDGRRVICRILHRCGGEVMDFYTPVGNRDFCNNLKEPCIRPLEKLQCLILDVNNATNEQIMLGYLPSESEIVGMEPASAGNLKLVSHGASNEFWVKFGSAGLDIRTPKTPVTNVGEKDAEMNEVEYANSKDVYTKTEIDAIVEELRKEIHGEDDADVIEG